MVKEILSPKLKNPIFIAAWPGMGEVAYRTVLFLKEVMECKMFAKLEASNFFKPSGILVNKGIVDLPNLPVGIFYYGKTKNYDIIIFLGDAQPSLEHAEALSNLIINFVKKYKIRFVFTFAAKPEPIEHKAESNVYIAATHKEILEEFKKYNLKVLNEGQITGLNGILLGVAKNKKLKGACLLGEIPFYTIQIENPRASMKILEILGDYLNINLNLSPIIERAKFIDSEIDKLIEYIKGGFEMPKEAQLPLSDEDIDRLKKDLTKFTKLPESARKRIDELFKAAQKDITIAFELKKELDHWNVYKEYEDKFLDLFKKKEDKEKSQ